MNSMADYSSINLLAESLSNAHFRAIGPIENNWTPWHMHATQSLTCVRTISTCVGVARARKSLAITLSLSSVLTECHANIMYANAKAYVHRIDAELVILFVIPHYYPYPHPYRLGLISICARTCNGVAIWSLASNLRYGRGGFIHQFRGEGRRRRDRLNLIPWGVYDQLV